VSNSRRVQRIPARPAGPSRRRLSGMPGDRRRRWWVSCAALGPRV